MPLSLSNFTVGEVAYVTKMNANNQAIIEYLAQLESTQLNVANSAISVLAMQTVLFGTAPAVFGEASFRTQAIGADLIVAAGTAWAPSQQLVVQLLVGATVSMTGRPAGTYYINAANGTATNPVAISTSPADALYSFTWSGSAISNLTRLARVLQPLTRGAEDVAFNASLSLDWSRSDTLRVTLTGDATALPIGAYDGQRCMLEVTQDASGGHTLTAGAGIRIGSDVAWAISTAPNSRTRLGLIYVGPRLVYDLVAVARGFTL